MRDHRNSKDESKIKLNLKEDPRVKQTLFDEDSLTMTLTMRTKQEIEEYELIKNDKENKKGTLDHNIEINEADKIRPPNIVLQPLSRIKVKVETTEIFPLDLKCTLLFTEEDLKFYDKMVKKQQ